MKEKEEDDQKEDNIDNKIEENKIEENKDIKAPYSNDKNINNEKISSCHTVFHLGIDVDISRKKIFVCDEGGRDLLFFLKKKRKIKTLLFFEEHYIYILKDIVVNRNNEKLRRIRAKLDLNKLYNYQIDEKKDNLLFTLQFIKNDNYFDRMAKKLLFDKTEGELFDGYLFDYLEKIDATFLGDIYEEEDNEYEEEENNEKEKGEAKNEEDNKVENEKNEEEGEQKTDQKKNLKLEDVRDMNVFSSSRGMLK